jgi:hypothetical protein
LLICTVIDEPIRAAKMSTSSRSDKARMMRLALGSPLMLELYRTTSDTDCRHGMKAFTRPLEINVDSPCPAGLHGRPLMH